MLTLLVLCLILLRRSRTALKIKPARLSALHFGDVSACPTSMEIRNTVGTDWFRHQVWGDRTCSSGCLILSHKNFNLPRCVVRRSTGLLNQALMQCLRQIDHMLILQIQRKTGARVLKYCNDFLNLQLFRGRECTKSQERVPRVLHTTSRDEMPPYHISAAVQADSGFMHRHVSDTNAEAYVRDRCSTMFAEVYRCIKPRAFRADLFRFCALYAEGGVYLDADLIPLVRLSDLYSPCSSFTLGYDQAQGKMDIAHIGMQMKILAGIPGNNVSACMLENIADHVRKRKQFKTPLEFSGPQLLRYCYLKYPEDVAITYIDTRGAAWPYTGLRAGTQILAYEKPNPSRHFEEILERDSTEEYNDMVKRHDIYSETCTL